MQISDSYEGIRLDHFTVGRYFKFRVVYFLCFKFPFISTYRCHSWQALLCALNFLPSNIVSRMYHVQVLITYGNRSNDDLLQYFGFVEPQNPFDVYTISSPVAKLQDILQHTGVQQDDMRLWLDDAVPGAELESLSEALRRLSKTTPSDSASEDKLVVNRKEPQTWALSSLTTLFAAENNSLILKSALAVLLKTEFNIVSRGMKNYSIELAGSCNESRLQDHNKLASVFLEEKLDVLQSALTHLTAWEN